MSWRALKNYVAGTWMICSGGRFAILSDGGPALRQLHTDIVPKCRLKHQNELNIAQKPFFHQNFEFSEINRWKHRSEWFIVTNSSAYKIL
jgi:hypothetical protein